MDDDRELLRQFVRENSQPAFVQILERHQNWLYSVCQRRLGDSALAEDAVQAVFLALVRRAPSLLNQRTISPWLHRAARFCASNLLRARRRRERYESEAAVMNSKRIVSHPVSPWQEIESDLEPALDRLKPRDREMILLRFYEQKNHAEIAAMLGISQEASHQRLARAIDRLRAMLCPTAKADANLSAVAIGDLLARNVVSPAPASLVHSLASLSTSTLPNRLAGTTKAIVNAMAMLKLKAVVAGIILCLIVPSTAFLFHRNVVSPPLAQAESNKGPISLIVAATMPATASVEMNMPWKFPNSEFVSNPPASSEWTANLDADVMRTTETGSAAHMQSTSPMPQMAYLRHEALDATRLRGKHIAISAWIKTKDLKGLVGLEVWIGAGKKTFAFDDMAARPIRGDIDWQQYQLVEDVPLDATTITLLAYMSGPGQAWIDGFQIDNAWPVLPVTSNREWHLWGAAAPRYTVALDPTTSHGGYPSICISSGKVTRADWVGFDFIDGSIKNLLDTKFAFGRG